MEKITLKFKKNYSCDVVIGYDILSDIKNNISPFLLSKDVVFITNSLVKQLYGDQLMSALSSQDIDVKMIEVPDGEQSKSMNIAKKIYDQLLEYKVSRSTTLITLGGGVIGDLGGFVAATFMRGVPLIHIPTTLLAQIDSSIGGKVAIDHFMAKNIIGSFYQPMAVLVDTKVLETLPVTHLRNGLVEAIKISIICSPLFFDWLGKHIDCILMKKKECMETIVNQAIKLKRNIVLKDPWEKNERLYLNLGHSIGHALETMDGYKSLDHGEAVAIGIILETQIAYHRNICNKEEKVKIENIIQKIGIPPKFDSKSLDLEKCWDTILLDKKNKNGVIRFILPESIGKVKIVQPILKEDVIHAFNSFLEGQGV